jgi:hypothetical protein
MSLEVELAQENFLRQGGVLQRALAEKMKSGEHTRSYVYQEYPKVIRLNEREEEVEHVTEDIKGRTLRTTSTKRVYDTVTVHSEEEEERVLAGGKTSTEIDQERLDLIQRARNLHIRVDPSWSVVRLKRELGEAMDAPADGPAEKLAKLAEELSALKRMAEMEAEIERLKSQLSASGDDLAAKLEAAGVKVDRRWSKQRMTEELERAQAAD